MEDSEFSAQILAKVLTDAGTAIAVGGEDSGELLRAMARERCCMALKRIREILDDDRATDAECFDRIERIVSLYEELGPGAGSRHDFG